jgi:hypothetical protein
MVTHNAEWLPSKEQTLPLDLFCFTAVKHCQAKIPNIYCLLPFFLQKRRQQHERIPNICPPPMEGTIFSQRILKNWLIEYAAYIVRNFQ